MPVTRSGVQGASSQNGLVQLSDPADQTAEPPEHVESVSYSQHVEERVADVGGESESLGFELHPGKSLPGHKQQAQEQSYIQPLSRIDCLIGILMYASHEVRNAPASHLDRH